MGHPSTRGHGLCGNQGYMEAVYVVWKENDGAKGIVMPCGFGKDNQTR